MAYDYIKRIYDREFKAGQRVVFTEYDNKPGTVARVRGDPQYVSVKFDDGTRGDCHPMSVEPAQEFNLTPSDETIAECRRIDQLGKMYR